MASHHPATSRAASLVPQTPMLERRRTASTDVRPKCRSALAAKALIATLLLQGCNSTSSKSLTPRHDRGATALTGLPDLTPRFTISPTEQLRSIAAQQRLSPAAAVSVTADGLNPAETPLLPAGLPPQRARVSLTDALRLAASNELAGDPTGLPLSGTTPAVSGAASTARALTPAQSLERTRAYVAGRARLVAGDAPGAMPLLDAAAALDPTSTQVLDALAEAQLGAGRRSAAVATYQRSIEAGTTDPRVRAFVGRELLRNKSYAPAAQLLAGVNSSADVPPLTRAVATADLSDALLQLGYVQASGELLAQTLGDLPDPATLGTLAPMEAELYRRRGELWQRAGDLLAASELTSQAEAAYIKAAQSPGANQASLARRQIATLLANGQTARAALALLQSPASLPKHASLLLLPQVGLLTIDAAWERALSLGQSQALDLIIHTVDSAAKVGQSHLCAPLLSWYLSQYPDTPGLLPRLVAATNTSSPAEVSNIFGTLALLHPYMAEDIAGQLSDYTVQLPAVRSWCAANSTTDSAAWMLRAALALVLEDRTDDQRAMAATPPLPIDDQTSSFMRTLMHAARGEWSLAMAMSDAITQPRLRAVSLAYLQRFDAAIAVATHPKPVSSISPPAFNGPAQPELATIPPFTAGVPLTMLFQWALEVGQWESAEKWMRRIIADQPTDERAYAGLFILYAPKAPFADEAKMARLAKDLREAIAESNFAASIAARDAISRNRFAAAAELVLPMLEQAAVPPDGFTLLVALCERSIASDPSFTKSALAAVDAQARRLPNHMGLVLATARLLVIDGQAAKAESYLKSKYELTPRRDIARLRELIIIKDLEDDQRAMSLALARLAAPTLDPDLCLELAQIFIFRLDFASAASVLARDLPPSLPLTTKQTARLAQLAAEIKPESLLNAGPKEAADALALFDAIIARGIQLPLQTKLARVILVCTTHPSDARRIYAAVTDACSSAAPGGPDSRERLLTTVVEVLLSKADPSDGLALLGEITNRSEPYDDRLAFEWFRLTFIRGDQSDVADLVKTSTQPRLLVETISRNSEGDVEQHDTDKSARAELAYWVGNGASSIGRDALALSSYRLALEFLPDHAWTLNNLGYNLLEGGGDITEAAEMIERAFALLPTEASVIDSLGWVRYKQGRFKGVAIDPASPADAATAGAVDLIERAVLRDDGSASTEQLLHYGDALYRVQKPALAITQWDAARRAGENQLALFKAARAANQPQAAAAPALDPQLVRLQRLMDEVTVRLEQAKGRKPVRLAATHAEAEQLSCTSVLVNEAGITISAAPDDPKP